MYLLQISVSMFDDALVTDEWSTVQIDPVEDGKNRSGRADLGVAGDLFTVGVAE